MSVAWFPNTPDVPNRPSRGAMAVGMLAELPAQERCAILAFRQWCDGTAGRDSVAQTFADLMGLMMAAPRRTLMRHGLSCACFGGDEAAFAHMISAATVGDREDAMLFALVLLQPDAAWRAVQLAQGVGIALLGLCRTPPTLN